MPRFNRLALSVMVCCWFLVSCDAKKEYQPQAQEVFPAVKIQRAALFRMDQIGITPAFFEGGWNVVTFASSDCGVACQHRLTLLNQLEDANGLMVIDDLADHQQLRKLAQDYPSVAISMGTSAASFDLFQKQFQVDESDPQQAKQFLYLVNLQAELVAMLPAETLQKGDIELEISMLP